MRFPKTLTFTCLLAVGTSVGYSQTADQQEKALRALHQYISQQESKTPAKSSPPPVAKPATANQEDAARKALEKMEEGKTPAAASTATAVTTSATPSALPSDEERKARAALDELRRAGARQATPTTSAPAVVTTPAPQTTVQTVKSQPTPTPTPAPAVEVTTATPSALPADKEAKARAALEALAGANAAQPMETQPAVAASTPQAEQPKPEATSLTPAPLKEEKEMPLAESTAAMSKKEKLQQILNLYIADQISPREYHERRAAILAGN